MKLLSHHGKLLYYFQAPAISQQDFMLAQADHGNLLRVMNRPYMQRCQEVQTANQRISALIEQIAEMKCDAAKLSVYKFVQSLHTF